MANKPDTSNIQDLLAISPSSTEDDRSIIMFPGVTEVVADIKPEIALDEIVLQQQILLERWYALGAEFKRRLEDIPFDLALGLADLLRETLS